ncbi:electron transport complex subunit RsxE [Gordonibacter sp. 28C]|uniref:electron transport complex subunit RsxE n=1 Tax=Gordonibacter sp. 28C TaxID=2078569 RepID=UPI001F53F9BC|nr:electron transport complex subunit E [Gordonibacter sp. 28C]
MMAATPNKPAALSVFSKGLLVENPTLRQMLGLCPTLAVTTAVTNGIGMGVATTFVLVCSGIVVSLLRNAIPSNMRLPAFITVIAGFVTIVMMLVEAYFPDLNAALGIYLPLIVVNCIVLGRAEVFASKHPARDAALDGLGMGVGFTITLVLMSAVREVLGAGTLLGFQVLPDFITPMNVFVMPPGGFAVLGVLIAASVALEMRRRKRAGEPEDDAVATQEDICAACQICDAKEREA